MQTRQQPRQAWKYLVPIFVVFWAIFALIITGGGFPFSIIAMALTGIALLSSLVIALAWAYQNNR